MESPAVVSFCQGGKHLVAGGFRTNRMVQIFDLSRPGRDALQTLQFGKTRRSKDGQKGLVSAMASGSTISTTTTTTATTETSLHYNLLAIGTYAPGSIYLYDERCYQGADEAATITISGNCVVGHGRSHGRKRKHYASQNATENKKHNNHKSSKKRVNNDNDNREGEEEEEEDNADVLDFFMAKIKWYQSRARGGVTQLEFTHDHLLYSASRRSNAILAWDLRRLSSLSSRCPGVASFETDNDTNQRLEFAIHPSSPTVGGGVGAGASQLWIGGRDGCVRVYDCQSQKLAGIITRSNYDSGGGMDGSGGCGAVNGVSLTDSSTNNNNGLLLALAVGSRSFPTEQDWSSSGDDGDVEVRGKSKNATNPVASGSLQLYEMDTSMRNL
jgi:hypothetical protein